MLRLLVPSTPTAVILVFLSCPISLVHGQESAEDAVTEEQRLSWWFLDRPPDRPLHVVDFEDHRVTLDIGGSVREQYEGYRNFEFGLDPTSNGWDEYCLHRLLVHADLRIDDSIRVYAEFGNSLIDGNARATSPVDEDDAYIHQAFVEVSFGSGLHSNEGGLRLGRQEIAFGSSRLFSLRNGPNIRRSFDAARLTFDLGFTIADVFVGSEVQIRPDAFDNKPDDAVLAWGLHTMTQDLIGDMNLDAYYFGIDRERSVFDIGASPETRHSLGIRVWGDSGVIDYNIEPVLQFGEFGDREIFAWTIASDTGIRLGRHDQAPRLGLRANVISGGHSSGRIHTFNALFPNNSYFSEAAIFAPANLIDLNPSLTVHPTEDVSLTFMWDFLWRYDTDDAIYVPPGVPAIAGDPSDDRFIGHSLSIAAEWRIRERLTVFAAYTHFQAGPAVSIAGGQDLDYFLLGMEWAF